MRRGEERGRGRGWVLKVNKGVEGCRGRKDGRIHDGRQGKRGGNMKGMREGVGMRSRRRRERRGRGNSMKMRTFIL